MKNADYWRGRFSILEESAHQEADQYIQSLEEMFMDAQRTVQADIERWYGRFASNNGISLTEARKMLTTGQLEEFRWTVDQYIKIGQQANLSAEWLKKLENASAKFHVSRLEAIQTQIQQQIELLYGNQLDGLDSLLKKIAGDGYTQSAFAIQKGIGLGWDITALNQKKLETLLSKPWTTDGRTFSDRIWSKKKELVGSVQKELTQGLLRGDSPQKITDAIKNRFNVSRYQAGRLVHTETTYFNAISTKQAYQDLGVEKIEILETLDSHTCEICQPLDGTVIPLAQYEPGVTVPPFHPNCRGTTCPHFADMDGERAARNAEGKVYYVPANMTYTQWKKAFVDGGSKDGLTVAVTAEAYEKLRSDARKKKSELNTTSRELSQVRTEKRLANMSGDTAKVDRLAEKETEIQEKIDVLQKELDSIFDSANIKTDTTKNLFLSNVDYIPVKKHDSVLDEQEIIQRIAGGDQTTGSCASVALSYAGQKRGYDVLDFRDGESREFFASKLNKIQMFKDLGVTSITADSAKSSLTNGKKILSMLEEGKEYYLSVGGHAAIVRVQNGVPQYLELQSNYTNGWMDFGDVSDTLKYRFACSSSSRRYAPAYATDISQLDGEEFENILGYINTNADKQRKGASGGVK